MTAVGTVYLVGAGPGDPELITVRAMRLLERADVILYDALVHDEQLGRARPDAELIFVGKRAGQASARQTRINERLVAEARLGKTVVRLKGGDPYLFGRGSEEAEWLFDAGVPFEVVPGVPSPLAATAYAGLSLTHRDLASSVAYLTATESPEKDRTSHDWARLATATQTLVIFMGRRRLPALMSLLITHGRSPDTPVAVIQWASLPKQRAVIGTVATIAQLVDEAGIGTPALTIVGEVVSLRDRLRWFDTQPLFGKRVLVTRAPHQADSLAALLRARGAQPVVTPTITITDTDPAVRSALLQSIETGDHAWTVFTSRNAVDRFFACLSSGGLDARAVPGRVVAIGPKTASALAKHGVFADVVPDDNRNEGVLSAMAEAGEPGRVLFPRAAQARAVLTDGLRDAGYVVELHAVYTTVGPTAEQAQAVRDALARDHAHRPQEGESTS